MRQSILTVLVCAVALAGILVSRGTLSLELTLPLEPSRATLRTGQTVTFDVEFGNSLP
jgi:hypothetical protein